jgi:methylated-DNA-[protein]-cysteine S-methyltransferase
MVFKSIYKNQDIVLEIIAQEDSIQSISFIQNANQNSNELESSNDEHSIVRECFFQLDEYFAGKRKEFKIPFAMEGTDFQKKVWSELLKIPYGQTITYLELAMMLGDEKCIRAAASANGRNKLVVLIPCHRVIGTNGSLTGYSGGIENKKRLLELEKKNSKLDGGLF